MVGALKESGHRTDILYRQLFYKILMSVGTFNDFVLSSVLKRISL